MSYRWNTGRHYDADGQRMVAAVVGDKLLFSDLSRHINGAIPLGNYILGREVDGYSVEALVMCNYDHGNYSSSNVTLTWEGK